MSKRQSFTEMLGIIAAAGMFGTMRGAKPRAEQRTNVELFGVANAERAREKHRQKIARRLLRWNGQVARGGTDR